MSLLLLLSILVLTCVNSFLFYKGSASILKEDAVNIVKAYKHSADTGINTYKYKLEKLASQSSIKDNTYTKTELSKMFSDEAKASGFLNITIADASGKTDKGSNISEDEAFTKAQAGETFIQSPEKNENGDLVFKIATPIANSKNVLYGEILYDDFFTIVADIKVGEEGYSFVIDSTGRTILHPTKESVENPLDYFELSKTDSSYSAISEIFKRAITGETGTGYSIYKGVKRLVAFTPIEGQEGWYIAITMPVSQVMSTMYQEIIISIILGIILLIAALIISTLFSNAITNPVIKATKRIELLAKGDLQTDVVVTNGKDEISRLSNALSNTISELRMYINDISNVLTNLSNKNFNIDSTVNYTGDFNPIKESLENILLSMNEMFKNIIQTSMQVNSASSELSIGAKNLAENSTEQASTVERLTDALGNISNQIHVNAENSISAASLSQETNDKTTEVNNKVGQLIASMKDIDDSSNEILKINKVMNDIAFQTNILALNAAVEASRAGEAGKGFAVVANEVRSLAVKSASAAENATELIQRSLDSVKKGMVITNETAESIDDIVDKVNQVNSLIDNIAEATNEQSKLISNINNGMMEISSVTQTNSATAEESAAASEELKRQAEYLKIMMEQFKIKK